MTLTLFHKYLISILILICLVSSCTTMGHTPQMMAEVSPVQSKELYPVDMKFSHVSLKNIHMVEAIIFLSDVIDEYPSKTPRFSWGIQVGAPSANPPSPINPLVNIEASSITLREILDKLCAQAGWTYEEVLERQMISFVAPSKK